VIARVSIKLTATLQEGPCWEPVLLDNLQHPRLHRSHKWGTLEPEVGARPVVRLRGPPNEPVVGA